MKAKELREHTKEEVLKKINDLKLELKNLRFAKVRGDDKNPLKRRNVRRDIARAMTIMKEKGWS